MINDRSFSVFLKGTRHNTTNNCMYSHVTLKEQIFIKILMGSFRQINDAFEFRFSQSQFGVLC